MPRLDGSGPLGMGPMTGRGMGMCIIGADALRRGVRAGRNLRRGPAMVFLPGMGRGAGWRMASGLGRGMVKGLGCAAILGLGYGFTRSRRRRIGMEGNTAMEANREPEGQMPQR